MALIRRKIVTEVVVKFNDGSIERWGFTEGTQGYYREESNATTESDPINESWLEHMITWVSDRQRPKTLKSTEEIL